MKARWMVAGMVVVGAGWLALTTLVPVQGQIGPARDQFGAQVEEGPIVRSRAGEPEAPASRRLSTEPRRPSARSRTGIVQTSMDDPPLPAAIPATGTNFADAPPSMKPMARPAPMRLPVDEDAKLLSGGEAMCRPALEVRQTMPESIRHGQPVPVELIVANNGSHAVERVMVTNDLPAGVDLVGSSPMPTRNLQTLVWSLGKLEPGQQKVINFRLILNQGGLDQMLRNSSSVRFESIVTNAARVFQPALVVEMDGPATAVVGGKTTFDIRVTNKGNAPATNVVLRDALPPGLTHPYGPELENEIGRIAVGETKKIRLSVTPAQAGPVVHKVVVSGDGLRPVEKECTLTIQQLEMALVANAAKSRYLNRPCEFQFTVANKGASESTDTKLVVVMPKGIAFVHAGEGGQHEASANEVHWQFGKMRPGETKQVALTCVGAQVGNQVCRAMLYSNGNVCRESTCATHVQGVAAMQMEVVDSQDPAEVGSETIYEIRLLNQGSAVQTNVRVACLIPPELQALDAKGPTKHELHGDQLVFEPIPSMATKAETVYKVKVKARKAGDCRFRVELTSDQHTKPLVREESTTAFGDEN